MYVSVCALSRSSRVWLFVTLWSLAHQAPLSLGFSRQEHWSGLPCPPPGDLPDQGISYICISYLLHWQAASLPPMDRGAWRATAHGVAKSDTTEQLHFHTLEKEMAIHSSVLAWRIPETEEPDGLPSMGSHRVGHDWSDLAAATAGRCLIIWATRESPCFSLLLLYFSVSVLKTWLNLDPTLFPACSLGLYLRHIKKIRRKR